jgi:DEAD/DEAH box helicase domain-containing protein
MVSSLATIYKKLRLESLENLGWGRIHLPELELHTTAYWVAVDPAAVAGWRRDELDVALVGAGRALQTVASVLLMSDPRDLGLVCQVRSPHAERPVIYLYDGVPGGVGLAARLFERHAELVAGARDLVADCPCDAGCPACTGPRLETGGEGKRLAARLLALLGGTRAEIAGAPAA